MLAGKMAIEVASIYDSPVILVFRGALLDVDVIERLLMPKKFIRFIGTSSTFLMVKCDGGYRLCNVLVIEEPVVYRNKLRRAGLFRLIGCSNTYIELDGDGVKG